MTNLTVLEGGRNKLTSHIYEVHDSDGNIVDVMRFETPEIAAEFQSGIKGEYYVKPHTLSVEELLDIVLDLYVYELCGDMDEE
ncbi:hypothetical protein [Lederbergia citri]|uniref:Uncharacterized protein n=1 Tax=Lederbergia citri TaxID=2833580 RepID=A0A942TBH7_9BACI|nr:hypothetical protein [Lederbergia citri]MBS4193479.1 hypothetical protein [Lederbergia citri]